MNIQYTLKEVRPNIFAVVVPDDYDRAMLFCRVQEFYESDSDLYREQDFSIWDYMKWYSAKNKGVFTYTKDWEGFNVPFKVALNCYIGNDENTPYDKVMEKILDKILLSYEPVNAYIIGTKTEKGQTFKHEICHALYYSNSEYKLLADEITKSIDWQDYLIFEDNLLSLCYTASVINDEIQAYMMTNYKAKYFSKGVDINILNELHNKYKEQLNKFLK